MHNNAANVVVGWLCSFQ